MRRLCARRNQEARCANFAHGRGARRVTCASSAHADLTHSGSRHWGWKAHVVGKPGPRRDALAKEPHTLVQRHSDAEGEGPSAKKDYARRGNTRYEADDVLRMLASGRERRGESKEERNLTGRQVGTAKTVDQTIGNETSGIE